MTNEQREAKHEHDSELQSSTRRSFTRGMVALIGSAALASGCEGPSEDLSGNGELLPPDVELQQAMLSLNDAADNEAQIRGLTRAFFAGVAAEHADFAFSQIADHYADPLGRAKGSLKSAVGHLLRVSYDRKVRASHFHSVSVQGSSAIALVSLEYAGRVRGYKGDALCQGAQKVVVSFRRNGSRWEISRLADA